MTHPSIEGFVTSTIMTKIFIAYGYIHKTVPIMSKKYDVGHALQWPGELWGEGEVTGGGVGGGVPPSATWPNRESFRLDKTQLRKMCGFIEAISGHHSNLGSVQNQWDTKVWILDTHWEGALKLIM